MITLRLRLTQVTLIPVLALLECFLHPLNWQEEWGCWALIPASLPHFPKLLQTACFREERDVLVKGGQPLGDRSAFFPR